MTLREMEIWCKFWLRQGPLLTKERIEEEYRLIDLWYNMPRKEQLMVNTYIRQAGILDYDA